MGRKKKTKAKERGITAERQSERAELRKREVARARRKISGRTWDSDT